MASGSLTMNRSSFERLIYSQLEQGKALLQRNIAEDITTFINRGCIVRTKEYEEEEVNKLKSDFRKWDAFNGELLSRAFNEINSPYSYYREYGRTGDPNNLLGEDSVKEIKNLVSEKITYLESILDRLPLISSDEVKEIGTPLNMLNNIQKSNITNNVFIVHGHDAGLKNEVARFITELGYSPIILHEQPNNGKTIIEKIESYTDVCFAIVLYTPCDMGAVNGASEYKPRARQNVVFEHGFLSGKIGRERVCALIKDDVEKPGDMDGIVYVTYDTHGAWKKDIAREMDAIGLDINYKALLK